MEVLEEEELASLQRPRRSPSKGGTVTVWKLLDFPCVGLQLPWKLHCSDGPHPWRLSTGYSDILHCLLPR